MQFNTYSYLLALTLVVSVFWMLPSVWRRWFVLLCSLAFYATWSVAYILLPIGICGLTYLFARGMADHPGRARAYLWGGIGTVLGVLAFFKYRTFVLQNLHLDPGSLGSFALPLGISFYTFEAISFLVDVRQGRVRQFRFSDLCLFVLFWPHLIAGPIVRVRELVPQFKFEQQFELSMMTRGLDRLLWGLFQKNVVANSIGSWVDDGFIPKMAALNTTVDNWFLAAAFGLQIYFDFSSYSNMAIGAAQLIGIRLPENFRSPYLAANPSDFWNRWHMTLSRWIRDYVFFPLAARYKESPAALYGSLIFVMGLVGLWHGAGWGFVLWGLMHGVYLVIFRALESRFSGVLSSVGWRLFVLVSVTAAWVPFRATSLEQAMTMLGSMFYRIQLHPSYSVNFYLLTLLVMLLTAIEPVLSARMRQLEEDMAGTATRFRVNTYVVRPALYGLALFFFAIFDDLDTKFIYFQF
jgi:D-alanyl-lipoteichoic acid acyltransferase DltB (MBOAT superfamily)